MTVSGYFVAILVFVLCMYTLELCIRDFRKTRGSGTVKPYLYVLGAVLSALVLLVAALAVLLIVVGPLH